MATDDVGLRVVGAKELRAAFKQIQDPNVTDQLKDAHFRIAEMLVEQARRNAAGMGRVSGGFTRPTRNRKHKFGGLPAPVVAASTLRAGRQAARATVTLGNNSVPFALGYEFGAYPDKRRERKSTPLRRGGPYVGWRQFPRPNKNGYFMYPALRQTKDNIAEVYLKAIDQIIAKIQ